MDLNWEDLSESTIERTKWMIADTMFAAWYGMGSKELQNYVNAVGCNQADAVNTIPIVGSGLYTTPYHHAIIHGTAIVCNELDEGNQFAKGHPAAHIFAPAFIAAIENNASGSDFIRAFIIGYEAASRLAYASNMKDDMHPHGTWGIIGGTVAAGILQKKEKKQIIEAALLAATLPLTTSWEAAVTGMTARNLYTGLGSLVAYQALQFQSFGFQSSAHVVDHVWGSLLSERMNYELFLQDLWSPPLLEKNYFKLYPSCRFSHSAIDAMLNLLQDEQVVIEQVESVKVDTYNLAARLDNPDPKNDLAAKFSIPFLLSTLLHGNTLFNSFNESVLFDPSVRSLAKEINVCEDPEMTELLPNKRAARVTITLKNGNSKTSYVDAASGGYEQSFPTARMMEKFKQMMASSLEEQQVERIVQATLVLDETNPFKQWVIALQN
ncbi:MmgE/PrpD family protein [Paenibacillus agricola]|uniref:MmgE/PrpD family protein n=1 Tax=Paenibacillus agricola TaxID=2716264 RepID=UPI001FB5C75C|nr:MmgE/PrpD family protein [Paenibacillus agricola]